MNNQKGSLFLTGKGVFACILVFNLIINSSFRFGNVPSKGELVLRANNPSNDHLNTLKFTRWRITDHEFKTENLEGLKFDMIIFPTYFESAEQLDPYWVRDEYGSRIVVSVRDVEKVSKSQFEGNVWVEMNNTMHKSKIFLTPALDQLFTFEAHFTISPNNGEQASNQDLNFQMNVYLN